MAAELYRWFPISRGESLPTGTLMAGRTKTDGAVYVGRNDAQEVGKLNVSDDDKMYNIWCHHGGRSEHGCILVLRPNSHIQWKPFKSGDRMPDCAVYGGDTRKDGKVYVARDIKGGVGKLNINKDGTIHNLWVHGYLFPWKEGDILVVSPGLEAWNPTADCDGYIASQRAAYLQSEQHFGIEEAQLQVMSEFPAQFELQWNPAAQCAGSDAETRSNWLRDHKGLSDDLARWRVMNEFPKEFASRECKACDDKSPCRWNPEADCGGVRAEERASSLERRDKLTNQQAQLQVMQAYPESFGLVWRPDAVCNEYTAEERSMWLQTEKGLSVEEARTKVMNEFTSAFA